MLTLYNVIKINQKSFIRHILSCLTGRNQLRPQPVTLLQIRPSNQPQKVSISKYCSSKSWWLLEFLQLVTFTANVCTSTHSSLMYSCLIKKELKCTLKELLGFAKIKLAVIEREKAFRYNFFQIKGFHSFWSIQSDNNDDDRSVFLCLIKSFDS